MAERIITGFFDSYTEAASAVRRLEESGVPQERISLVANHQSEVYAPPGAQADDEDREHDAAGAGATVGALAGGGVGLLAGLGMVALPGLGHVMAAGWLASTLVGAGTGAAVGGLVGSLVSVGVDEKDAQAYAEGIRRGGALVSVRAEETETDRIADILDDEGRVDLSARRDAWRTEERTSSPPIGAAASMTTGLTTDLMPPGLDLDKDSRIQVDVEDERDGDPSAGTGKVRDRL